MTANLSVTPDQTMLPKGSPATRHLKIHITAPGRPAGGSRKPVEIAFVLDRSGSMGGEKIVLAKAALTKALEALGPQDRFTIVAFDTYVEVVAKATDASPDAKRAALAALANVQPRGGTNLCEGWLLGAAELAGKISLSRVMLLTDGQANEGETDRDALESHAAQLRKRGVSLTTFGIGRGFDEVLLQALSTAGGGNFYYIEKDSQIPEFVTSELGEALEVVATGVTLSIVHDPQVEIEPLSALAAESKKDHLRLFLGSLVADQELDIILRLKVAEGDVDRHLSVSATSVDGAFSGQAEVSFIAVEEDQASVEKPNAEVIREVAAVDLARTAQQAVVLNRMGNYAGAYAAMAGTIHSYEGYADQDADLAATLVGVTQNSLAYSAPMSEGALKGAHWTASNTMRGRTVTGKALTTSDKKGGSPS
jgi:Ca-activated chloride channel family protein